MVTLAHTRFFSVDLKCKYRLNFSFKKITFSWPTLSFYLPNQEVCQCFLESMLAYSPNVLGRRLKHGKRKAEE